MGIILPRRGGSRGAISFAPKKSSTLQDYLGVLKGIKNTVPFVNPLFKGIWRAIHSPSSSPRQQAAGSKMVDGFTPDQQRAIDEWRRKQEEQSIGYVDRANATPMRRGAPQGPLMGRRPLARGGEAPPPPRSMPRPGQPPGVSVLGGDRLSISPGLGPMGAEAPAPVERSYSSYKPVALQLLSRVPGIADHFPGGQEEMVEAINILATQGKHPRYDEIVAKMSLITGPGAGTEMGRGVPGAYGVGGWPSSVGPMEPYTLPGGERGFRGVPGSKGVGGTYTGSYGIGKKITDLFPKLVTRPEDVETGEEFAALWDAGPRVAAAPLVTPGGSPDLLRDARDQFGGTRPISGPQWATPQFATTPSVPGPPSTTLTPGAPVPASPTLAPLTPPPPEPAEAPMVPDLRMPYAPAPLPAYTPPPQLFGLDVPLVDGRMDVGEFGRRLRARTLGQAPQAAPAAAGGIPEDISQMSLAQLRAIRRLATSPADIARLGEAARARGKYERAPGLFEAISGETGAEEGEKFVLKELAKPMTALDIQLAMAKIAELYSQGRNRDAQALKHRVYAEVKAAGIPLTKAQTRLTHAKASKEELKAQRIKQRIAAAKKHGSRFHRFVKKNPEALIRREINVGGIVLPMWGLNSAWAKKASPAQRLAASKVVRFANKEHKGVTPAITARARHLSATRPRSGNLLDLLVKLGWDGRPPGETPK